MALPSCSTASPPNSPVSETHCPEANRRGGRARSRRGGDNLFGQTAGQGDRLFARLEAGQFFGTEGCQLETNRWYHVAAVKQADQLTLYVDGAARATAAVPGVVASAAENFALGGNPNYVGGPEFLAAQLADLRFYVRALTAHEVQTLFQAGAATTNR